MSSADQPKRAARFAPTTRPEEAAHMSADQPKRDVALPRRLQPRGARISDAKPMKRPVTSTSINQHRRRTRMSTSNPTFATVLTQSEPDPTAARELRRYMRRAFIPLAVTYALLILWSSTAPLSGA